MPQDPMLFAHLESFVEVARQGNVSRAAQALFLTQPAITARLKSLESDLGVELFVRTHRGVRLTDAGRSFLPYAERTIATVGEGRQLLANLRQGTIGTLVVAAAPAVSTYVLPRVLHEFRATHPNVRLGVRTGLGPALNVTVNIATPDVESFRRSQSQVAAMLARAIGRGQRNM